jgi:hypothetical protein
MLMALMISNISQRHILLFTVSVVNENKGTEILLIRNCTIIILPHAQNVHKSLIALLKQVVYQYAAQFRNRDSSVGIAMDF